MRIAPQPPRGAVLVERLSLHGPVTKHMYWLMPATFILAGVAAAMLLAVLPEVPPLDPGRVGGVVGYGALLFAGSTLLFVLHELVHGAAVMAFGGKPRYGMKMLGKVLPIFYTHAPGAIRRNGMIVILLAPLAVISTAAIPLAFVLPVDVWTALVLTHTCGCVGDLLMTAVLFRHRSDAWVGDNMDSIDVYDEPTVRVPTPLLMTREYTVFIRWCSWFTVFVIVIFFLSFFFPDVRTTAEGQVSVRIGPAWWMIPACAAVALGAALYPRKPRATR